MNAAATLISLSREDARELFARGEPGSSWTVLMGLLEKYGAEPGRCLALDPSWHSLQQVLEDQAAEGTLAAARQLLSAGQPLPGLEGSRDATIMRPDLVPHAARELAELVECWPGDDDHAWQALQPVAALMEQAASSGYCVVFISGV